MVLDSTFLIDVAHGRPGALAPDDEAARGLDARATFVPIRMELAELAAGIQHEMTRRGRRMTVHDLQVGP